VHNIWYISSFGVQFDLLYFLVFPFYDEQGCALDMTACPERVSVKLLVQSLQGLGERLDDEMRS